MVSADSVHKNAASESVSSEVVAVAMSGGVDSAVTAALLVQQGVRAFGITAKMTQEHSRCGSDEDICRASRMCEQLGIEHHVVDVCDAFQAKVIEPFMTSYLSGQTPSPCVICNREIKFGILLDHAMELGADCLATGHYVRIKEADGHLHLQRGVDSRKDQSYFLSRLTQEQLRHSRFPLGPLQKTEVSQLAADFSLEARKSRESQELCFVTEGTHGDWIDLRSFESRGAGDVVDQDGNVLGQHRGIHHYTIGQRKGLGIAVGHPIFISAIDAEHNRIMVGDREHALGTTVNLRDMHWTQGEAPAKQQFLCQVRYNHRGAPCHITGGTEGVVTVTFDDPQFAITPGQLGVLYDGDCVAGAGWIV